MLLVRLAVWALIAFHALLLMRRIGDATLADPVIALRWLGAAVLLLAGWLHSRRGGSLIAGRGALAFWVAVLLLHAFALAPGAAPVVETPVPVWSLGLLAAAVPLLVRKLTPTASPRFHAAADPIVVPTLDRIARLWGRPPPISLSA